MLLITLPVFMGSRLIEGRHSAESVGVLGKAPPRWMPAPSRHAQPWVGVHEPLGLVTLDDSGTLARRVSARAMGGVGADARSIRTRCVPTVASNKLLRVARQNHTSCGE